MPGNKEHDATRRIKPASMPYIMPDGRPLSTFLTDNNLLRAPQRRSKKRHGLKEASSEGWTTGAHHTQTRARPFSQLTEAEQAELAALEKVGQRRQRRYLNDKLLRDMAPALTAKDIESLFKPVPFGETGRVSVFTLATAPEVVPLWDLFRSIDADKEARVLRKWEEHVNELRQNAHKQDMLHSRADNELTTVADCNQSLDAVVAGWKAISVRGRRALLHAPRACIEDLESHLLGLLQGPPGPNEVALQLEDGFLRLITHALAEFHFLRSFSRNGRDGVREVVVRRSSCASSRQNLQEFDRILCSDVLDVVDLIGPSALSHDSLRDAVEIACFTQTSSVLVSS